LLAAGIARTHLRAACKQVGQEDAEAMNTFHVSGFGCEA
jgi:hypothetical protein